MIGTSHPLQQEVTEKFASADKLHSKVHGVLMILTFCGLNTIAAFVGRFFKETSVNSKNCCCGTGLWLSGHVAFVGLSYFTLAMGLTEILGKDLKSSCTLASSSESCSQSASIHQYGGLLLVGVLVLCTLTGFSRKLASAHAVLGYALVLIACGLIGAASDLACSETRMIAGSFLVIWILISVIIGNVIQYFQNKRMQTLTPHRSQFPLEALEYVDAQMPLQAGKSALLMIYVTISATLCAVLIFNYGHIYAIELSYEETHSHVSRQSCFINATGEFGFPCSKPTTLANLQLSDSKSYGSNCLKPGG